MFLRLSVALQLVMVSLLAAPSGAAEQPDSSWENLWRLKTGQRVEVVQIGFTSTTGKFLSASEESILLQAAQNEITVPRASILRITRSGGKRGRNALIGAAMAGGLGAAVGAAVGIACDGYFCEASRHRAGAAFLLGAIGAIVGAGGGAFFGGHTTIYRAPPPQKTSEYRGLD